MPQKNDMKAKMIERLVAMRVKSDNNKYIFLEQDGLLRILSNVWGQCTPEQTMHHNDRIRIYGTVIKIRINHPL